MKKIGIIGWNIINLFICKDFIKKGIDFDIITSKKIKSKVFTNKNIIIKSNQIKEFIEKYTSIFISSEDYNDLKISKSILNKDKFTIINNRLKQRELINNSKSSQVRYKKIINKNDILFAKPPFFISYVDSKNKKKILVDSYLDKLKIDEVINLINKGDDLILEQGINPWEEWIFTCIRTNNNKNIWLQFASILYRNNKLMIIQPNIPTKAMIINSKKECFKIMEYYDKPGIYNFSFIEVQHDHVLLRKLNFNIGLETLISINNFTKSIYENILNYFDNKNIELSYRKYENIGVFFIIGQDNYDKLLKWKNEKNNLEIIDFVEHGCATEYKACVMLNRFNHDTMKECIKNFHKF